MSEYLYVEKHSLDQLAALGWTVIDQGQGEGRDDEPAPEPVPLLRGRLPGRGGNGSGAVRRM